MNKSIIRITPKVYFYNGYDIIYIVEAKIKQFQVNTARSLSSKILTKKVVNDASTQVSNQGQITKMINDLKDVISELKTQLHQAEGRSDELEAQLKKVYDEKGKVESKLWRLHDVMNRYIKIRERQDRTAEYWPRRY